MSLRLSYLSGCVLLGGGFVREACVCEEGVGVREACVRERGVCV